MMPLLDQSERIVHYWAARWPTRLGQLITPLSRYRPWSGMFGVDNGAFSGFNEKQFLSLLSRLKPHRERCFFVAAPDIVANARRTLDSFTYRWAEELIPWPAALVAQDGIEDLPIPWPAIRALFIGGSTKWKLSNAALDVIRCAKLLGKWVHIGRVNTVHRMRYFTKLGCDSFDGSGLSRYDWMKRAMINPGEETPLFARRRGETSNPEKT